MPVWNFSSITVSSIANHLSISHKASKTSQTIIPQTYYMLEIGIGLSSVRFTLAIQRSTYSADGIALSSYCKLTDLMKCLQYMDRCSQYSYLQLVRYGCSEYDLQ